MVLTRRHTGPWAWRELSEVKPHIQAQMTVSGGVIITGPGKGCLRNGGERIEYPDTEGCWTSPDCTDKDGLRNWPRYAQVS